MRASCIIKPLQIAEVSQQMPKTLRQGEVLLRVKRVGICGSDVHIYQGHNPFATYPRVWGHEFAGEVIAIGDGVTGVSVGDHVVGEPYLNCGRCYACRQGQGNVCKDLKVFGVHLDGGAREYVVMEEGKVYKVDKNVPWDVAVLAEPLTIGFHSVARGQVKAGDIVLVMGSGTIGITVMLAAKATGATVICTDILDDKLDYVQSLGADYVINVAKQDQAEAIRQLLEGEQPNVVIDCIGNKSSLESAVVEVSPAGRVVELGFSPIASEIPHVIIMQKEVDVRGTRLQSGEFPEAIAYIERNQDRLASFVTQRYTMDQIPEAFQMATARPEAVRKIVIVID